MSTQFHIFKNNTDAPATNRGFYFQYLLTLKEWVKNIDKQDYEIYCEVEEDILAVDHRTHQHQYTQIKCYASGFSLNSEEVIKSLLNFYKLYLQNKGFFKSTYLFCATKAPRPRAGKLLQEWYAQQLKGDFSITPYILPVRQALLDYLNESFRKYSISTNDPQLVVHAETVINNVKDTINHQDFEDFLACLRWDFKEYSNNRFEPLLIEISGLLDQTDFDKAINVRVFLSYLLHQIIAKSSEHDRNDRKLDKQLFEQMLIDSRNRYKIHETLHDEFANILGSIPAIEAEVSDISKGTRKILQKMQQLTQPVHVDHLNLFYEDLKNWLTAIGYSLGNIDFGENNYFVFDIEIQERRRRVPVLIIGLLGTIQVPNIELGKRLLEQYDCEEVWIVSKGYPSPATKKRLESEDLKAILCYNFDELIEETIDFSKYFDWVEHEIKDRRIDENFIPMGIKKGEFNALTKEVIATSYYKENEGWLQGYIDLWLHDLQKEHVSILGEFGMGKTWFSLYYTWNQIKAYNAAKQNRTPRPRIPILIFLRDFAKAMQVDVLISDFFFRKHQIDIKGVFNAFDQLNKMGKLLLLFDGFDEMAERVDKQKMIDNFWELASVVKGQSKVILTCRNEHFATINEGRNLMGAELKTATVAVPQESPKFEVVELLKFEPAQIKQLLSHITNAPTIDLIFRHPSVVDLLSRPIMAELVLDAIREVEQEQELDLAKIYFYAIRRKMERDIAHHRTFTSLHDKLFFMCELAWEMFANDKLSISYKEFPAIIYNYFKIAADQKDLDYWRYDLRGQSMLIIDDEGGNYKPAHKSMLEFFVAYKIGSELGILKDQYVQNEAGKMIPTVNQPKSLDNLLAVFGKFLLASSKMRVVADFLMEMITNNHPRLWVLFAEASADKVNNKFFLNNILYILTQQNTDFRQVDLSNLELFRIQFEDADLTGSNFENTIFNHGVVINCDLSECNFENVKISYEHGYPNLRDVSGMLWLEYLDNTRFVRVGRMGFNLTDITQQQNTTYFPFFKRGVFVHSFTICRKKPVLLAAIDDGILSLDLSTGNQLFFSHYCDHNTEITFDKNENRFVTFSDPLDRDGEIHIWQTETLEKKRILVKNNGIFTCCFINRKNELVAGGRDGKLLFIDLNTDQLIRTVTFPELEKHTVGERRTHSAYIYSIKCSADEKYLAIGSTLHNIIIWDIADSRIAHTISLPEDAYCTSLRFSPDGSLLACDLTLGQFALYETVNWQPVFQMSDSVECFNFSLDSKRLLYASGYEDANVKELNLENYHIENSFNFDQSFHDLNIKNMLAPAYTIKYFLKRGATGWFTREDLLVLPQNKFDMIHNGLGSKPIDTETRAVSVDKLLNYINDPNEDGLF